MPEGGTLNLSTSNAVIGDAHVKARPEMKQGKYVVLSVSDTGQGIDAETLPLIFEPFFTTKETGKGTGLGLPTAYGIVKQSGGYIYCESEPGKGTKFTLYFPRCILEKTSESAEAVEIKAHKGTETILLAEDEDSVRSLTTEVLKKGGYEVIAVRDGESALEEIKARSGEIQFLLTDVVMPKMNGMQLAQEVKKLFPGIRILYVSGYAQDVVGNLSEMQRTDFIHKPFKSEALLRKIREILDRGEKA
jgi:two-component system cell cycle sensor histidine kinase/response regulator CckA